MNNKKILVSFLYHSTAIIIVIAIMIPFFWMLSTSFKSNGALMVIPVQWLPQSPTFENYISIFKRDGILLAVFNSFCVAFGSVAVSLTSAAMAAFAFAKIKFPGRELLFFIFLASLMIPSQVLFIPLYLLLSEFMLVNNMLSLILPGLFKAFAIFMLRQQMLSLSDTYIEAASIDGASVYRVFFRIIIPMCRTTLITIAVMLFIDSWNDYLLPLVMLSKKSSFTLPIILNSMAGQYKTEYNLLMSGALVSMLPALMLYGFAQNYFASGLQVGGIKG